MTGPSSLKLFAWFALASLVAVSVWASLQVDVTVTIRDLLVQPAAGNNPWLIATLFDAYFGFLWFWLWIVLREPGWAARGVWLSLILVLGNMAMAAYMLLALRRLPPGAPATRLFTPARP